MNQIAIDDLNIQCVAQRKIDTEMIELSFTIDDFPFLMWIEKKTDVFPLLLLFIFPGIVVRCVEKKTIFRFVTHLKNSCQNYFII